MAPGEVAPISAYTLGEVSRKAATRVAVFRFYNTGTGSHFYTTNSIHFLTNNFFNIFQNSKPKW